MRQILIVIVVILYTQFNKALEVAGLRDKFCRGSKLTRNMSISVDSTSPPKFKIMQKYMKEQMPFPPSPSRVQETKPRSASYSHALPRKTQPQAFITRSPTAAIRFKQELSQFQQDHHVRQSTINALLTNCRKVEQELKRVKRELEFLAKKFISFGRRFDKYGYRNETVRKQSEDLVDRLAKVISKGKEKLAAFAGEAEHTDRSVE